MFFWDQHKTITSCYAPVSYTHLDVYKRQAIMSNHHDYLHELHASGDQSYLAEQAARRKEYLVPLQQIKY